MHHNTPANMLAQYDITDLPQFHMQPNIHKDYPYIEQNSAAALTTAKATDDLPNMQYTNAELLDITAFLYALTDPCVKDTQCLSPWMLSKQAIATHPKEMQLLDVSIKN
jgi:cytochrome c peroxidase